MPRVCAHYCVLPVVSSASHWGIVHGVYVIPGYTLLLYNTQLQYNMLHFGVSTTQHGVSCSNIYGLLTRSIINFVHLSQSWTIRSPYLVLVRQEPCHWEVVHMRYGYSNVWDNNIFNTKLNIKYRILCRYMHV